MKIRHYIIEALILLAVPAMAQEADSLLIDKLPESALDHMLQNPLRAKRYEHKRFGDHFFFEGGSNIRFILKKETSPRFGANVAFGDWATPEHGWRVGVNVGQVHYMKEDRTLFGVSADYLLNFNALCAWNEYNERKPFEVYGVAGLDLYSSKFRGKNEVGMGGHLGLRGQVNFSSLAYFFMEPQVAVVRDNALHIETFHKFRFTSSVQLGFGYNWNQNVYRSGYKSYNEGFLDNTFFSFFGGSSAFMFDDANSFSDGLGWRVGLGFGKNFTPIHAVRLSFHTGANKQGEGAKLAMTALQADYLLNMHNLFGGYKENRPFWLNAVAGFGAYFSSSGNRKGVLGAGLGLQGNVRVSDHMTLYVEPRLDAYKKRYAPNYAAGDYAAVGTVMAGVTYNYHATPSEREMASDFSLAPWQSHLFFDIAGGVTAMGRSDFLRRPFHYLRGTSSAAAGMWLSPSSGFRLWGSMGNVRPAYYANTLKYLAFGADYLWNITNTVRGYDPDRKQELVFGIGLTAQRSTTGNGKFSLGGRASIRRQWNINRMLGIFVEPELRIYKDGCVPGYESISGMDIQGNLMAGLQFKMNALDASTYSQPWEEDGVKGYFSIAAGPAAQNLGSNDNRKYGALGRLSYVQLMSPLNMWRYNLSIYGNLRSPGNMFTQGTVGVDFMTDFTARTFGYDPDRLLSVKGFAGVALGMSYQRGDKKNFATDLEAGLQLSFRVSQYVNLYLEPQVAWSLNGIFDRYTQRPRPALLVGVDYMLKRREKKEQDDEIGKENFASAAAGIGLYSCSLNAYSGMKKVTFTSDVAYGRWLAPLHGVRVGAAFTRMHNPNGNGDKVNSFHVDYMINLNRAIMGVGGENVHVTGILGLNLTMLSRKNMDTRFAPGLDFGLQVGWRVVPFMEIFAEPAGFLYTKKLTNGTHPFEGEVKLMIGTKVLF